MSSTTDNSSHCLLDVKFEIHDEAKFKTGCEKLIEMTKDEKGVMYYGFDTDGKVGVCREAYGSPEALVEHLNHVGGTLGTLSNKEVTPKKQPGNRRSIVARCTCFVTVNTIVTSTIAFSLC
jgi:hypothetical protein